MSNATSDIVSAPTRNCLRDPIPEIADAARCLDAAISAHLVGRQHLAEELIRLADIPAITEWTESLWGKNSLYNRYRTLQKVKTVPSSESLRTRMPTSEGMRQLDLRDGYRCRFCGIPVVRKEVRNKIRGAYPNALRWGRKNAEQHAAFQAMWAQYDHLIAHALGGNNELSNLVVTCAPCNFGRMNHPLEDVGLADPRTRSPLGGNWDGLERFR